MPAENQILEQLEALGRRVESTGAGDTPEPLRRVLARRRFRRRVNTAVLGTSCVLIIAAAGYGIMLSAAEPRDALAPEPLAPLAGGSPQDDPSGTETPDTHPLTTAGAMRQHWAATGDLVTGPSSLTTAREPMRAGEHRAPDAVADWFRGR